MRKAKKPEISELVLRDAHQSRLLIIEVIKMKLEVLVEKCGVSAEIPVTEGDTVDGGQMLSA